MVTEPGNEVGETARDEQSADGLMPQLALMLRVLLASPVAIRLLLLTISVVLVVVATVYGQIKLNNWNQPFYDALAHRDFPNFIIQLGVFAEIAGALLVLNVAQRWLAEMIKLKLREALAGDLVREWLQPRRAFRLSSAGLIGINPDQRMHEDTRHLCELSSDLAIGCFQATALLFTFLSVLWVRSGLIHFQIFGQNIAFPGYMVWAAVIYTGSASILSYKTGRPLIRQNAERYGREAAFRFSLMRVNEHIDAIALCGGETDEERRIERDFQSVLTIMRNLVTSLTRLTWVTAGYGWTTLVVPIIVAAPSYFMGRLSFGGMMLAVGAFNQVMSSLRWFVDNFSVIADWRATLFRVASFRRAVEAAEILHHGQNRITFAEGKPRTLTLEKVEIDSDSSRTRLMEGSVEIKAGERVLIIGRRSSGKTLLFHALSGLWPWGSGQILWPKGESVLHIPRVPYLPPGTLRDVLAYPAKVESFDQARFAAVLTRLGLERLIPMLDETRPWLNELSGDEQQAVAFARALLQKPAWVLVDEALESIYEETRQRVMDVLKEDLAGVGMVYIGRTQPHDHFFTRVLHLVREARTAANSHSDAGDAAETPLAEHLS